MNKFEISLPRKLTNQLLHQALLTPDQEICGLIGADASGQPSSCYPISNHADNPHNQFLLDAQQQIAAMQTMRAKQEQLFAIYHSHPTTAAIPSHADLKQTAYPEALQIIISLSTKGILELRAFRCSDNTAHELNINLIEV
ncbi:M67 family metallopeptidase [Methylomonas sp. AM2-LC]|uniref:M67 family metallopeptidase n=1 Tax=Methylomonas sp. AM2-LC TaxID=3153301 RepID=UPI0032636FEA